MALILHAGSQCLSSQRAFLAKPRGQAELWDFVRGEDVVMQPVTETGIGRLKHILPFSPHVTTQLHRKAVQVFLDLLKDPHFLYFPNVVGILHTSKFSFFCKMFFERIRQINESMKGPIESIEKKNIFISPAGVLMRPAPKRNLCESNNWATDIKVSAWLSIIALPPPFACQRRDHASTVHQGAVICIMRMWCQLVQFNPFNNTEMCPCLQCSKQSGWMHHVFISFEELTWCSKAEEHPRATESSDHQLRHRWHLKSHLTSPEHTDHRGK